MVTRAARHRTFAIPPRLAELRGVKGARLTRAKPVFCTTLGTVCSNRMALQTRQKRNRNLHSTRLRSAGLDPTIAVPRARHGLFSRNMRAFQKVTFSNPTCIPAENKTLQAPSYTGKHSVSLFSPQPRLLFAKNCLTLLSKSGQYGKSPKLPMYSAVRHEVLAAGRYLRGADREGGRLQNRVIKEPISIDRIISRRRDISLFLSPRVILFSSGTPSICAATTV